MIIDGEKLSSKIKKKIKEKVKDLSVKPGLAVILVGNNPESEIYVSGKEKIAKEIGFNFKRFNLTEKVTKEELIKIIEQLNNDNKIHGIIVQLPLPQSLNEEEIINYVSPKKDVDGLTAFNIGKFFRAKKIEEKMLIPATAKAVLSLIESTEVTLEGKHAVVIGRSNLGGKPIAISLLTKNCTVTICHSKTKNLGRITKTADILVVSIGKPKLITARMVKKGAIVIDVGINRIETIALLPRCEAITLPRCKIIGDVNFQEVKKVAGFITPVPGGVGPMTIASLMENTLQAYYNSQHY